MRPGRILLFLLAVILTLSILSLVIAQQRLWQGPQINESYSDSATHHTVVSDTTLSDSLSNNYPAARTSVEGNAQETAEDSSVTPSAGVVPAHGLVPAPGPATARGAARADTSSSPSYASAPFYPGDALRDSLAEGRQVRIIYFGDSQVEGDRVTSLLRKELRAEGGGTGPGLIAPVMPVMYTRSYVVRSSSNWKRYTLLDYRNGILPHNRLGPMLALCRFTPPGTNPDSRSFASVRISPVPDADPSVSRYDKLRIFYGNNYDTILVGIRSGSTLVDFAMLQMGEGPLEYAVPLPSVSDITVEFTGRNSPDIYALSLESDTGVIVDNIPVRGSAGLEFVMTDIKGVEGVLSRLDPDLIFLHFGLNVVRNVRSEYHYYEEGIVKQIEYLKKATGGVPVVLVSVTDMALKSGDTIRQFPNIRAIRDAQKKAAARSGVIFWDAWQSMGGSGSIIKWHNYLPPLASKDLTHLSNDGADTIAARIMADLLVARTPPPERHPMAPAAGGPVSAGAVETVRHMTAADTLHPQATAGDGGGHLSASPGTAGGGSIPASETDDDGQAAVSDTGHGDQVSLSADEEEGDGWVAWLLKYHPRQSFIFTTTGFWIFFLIVMAGFALVHKKRAMCHTWLLLVSLYFYYRAGGLFIILLLLTTVLTYSTALMTGRAGLKAGKRFWLVTNIVLLLGFLSYFKYAGFITETVNSIFNTAFVAHDIFSAWSNSLFGTSFDIDTIVLPVGISFFTFQALSYSIDVYRGRMTAERNFIDFAFYLTFFPQLVAGPIVRASEFIPQMRGEYSISRNEFGYGLFLILQGLVKKMLISDFISAGFIDRVFDTPAIFSGFENLMAVYGYGLQIYCDFSGYTDIAIGVAMLMGFRLPLTSTRHTKLPI